MHKFPIYNYSNFAELPFSQFDEQKFSVYILDFDWNYLFVNTFACHMLGKPAQDLLGKNMWEVYEELKTDPHFAELKKNTENKIVSYITTVSPVTGERVSISSYPLQDCYYFTVSILPKKDALIDDLRTQLKHKRHNK